MQLNSHQQAVVDHVSGPAVVFAAAGSGKTTCMVRRAVNLVDSGVDPTSIQILVYNRSASEVVSSRLSAINPVYSSVRVNTFHSLASQLCREFMPEFVGSKKILDTEGAPKQISVVFEAMRDANIREGEWKEWMLRADLARELLISTDEVAAFHHQLHVPSHFAGDLQRFCQSYADIKERRNVIDFNDLLWALACNPDFPGRIHGRYKHLMVDEAQDATPLRWHIADSIAFGRGDGDIDSYVAVGDPCQSIYAYQGADPSIFMERGRHWQTFVLPVNFRSGRTIIDLGNRVVDGREWKIGDAIGRDGVEDGGIQRLGSMDDTVKYIRRSIDAGWSLEGGHEGSTVILCRTNADLAAYEVSLIVNGVPCRTRNSSGSVWESQYGTLFLSYLQFCNGGHDNVEDAWQLLESIYTRPNRFIRKETLKNTFDGSIASLMDSSTNNIREFGHTLWRVSLDLSDKRTGRFGRAVDTVASLLSQDVKKRAGNVLGQVDEDKIGLVNVLASAATQAGSIDGILDMVDSVANAADTPHVLLSTIHRAKGGEWKRVYADVGWVKAALSKRVFDSSVARVFDSISNSTFDSTAKLTELSSVLTDEDARLLYVEVTRAIDELYLIGDM